MVSFYKKLGASADFNKEKLSLSLIFLLRWAYLYANGLWKVNSL